MYLEDDLHGRQYFLNFLLKTSLFGEFSYDALGLPLLGRILSACLVVLVGITCLGFIRIKHSGIKQAVPLAFTQLILLVALIAYRFRYPWVPAGDFRFVYPMIIPTTAFFTVGTNWLWRWANGIGRLAFVVLITMFLCGSSLFFLIPLYTLFR